MIPLSKEQAQGLVDGAECGSRTLSYLEQALEAFGDTPGPIPVSERQAADLILGRDWSTATTRYLEDALEARGWRFDSERYDWLGPEAELKAEPSAR